MSTRIITPDECQPVPRFTNHIDVLPGQKWGPRTIGDPELVLVVAGNFSYRTNTGERFAGAGDVLFIPTDEVHTLEFIDHKPGHFSCIHGELLADGLWRNGDYRPLPFPSTLTSIATNTELRDLFRQCNAAMHTYSHFSNVLAGNIYHRIWIMLSEYWISPAAIPSLSPRMQRMLDWLQENLVQSISRKDLAKAFGLAPEYVNALFKHEIGITPTQYIHRERVMLAQRLLADEGLSVKEAAAQAGFNDPFYFSRVFKKVTGIPPSLTSNKIG